MDLKDFIAETLLQIAEGVEQATARIEGANIRAEVNPRVTRGGLDNPEARATPVEFDVALTVGEAADENKNEKLGTSVGLISVISAKVAGEVGSQRTSRHTSETVSRVRFSIPLALPTFMMVDVPA